MFCLLLLSWHRVEAGQITSQLITVQAGDTWSALAIRFDVSADDLRQMNTNVVSPLNPQREPPIGVQLAVPTEEVVFGRIHHPANTTPLLFALTHQIHPKRLPTSHFIPYQALIIEDETTLLRDLPLPFSAFELSHTPMFAGQGIGFRGISADSRPISVTLVSAENEPLPFDTFRNEAHVVGLRGTGAFFRTGTVELTVASADAPLWSQPYFVAEQTWDYQNLTLTGTAAQIDSTAIQTEGARLFELWAVAGDEVGFSAEFTLPISDFLEYSSAYGARRSYNGGGYNSYHEGVDFSAYGGTPVFATNSGTVVVAETLYVRGGAVIIDHGLGIYSGVYHLSEVLVEAGTQVTKGQQIGAVGTTGLSTGNHLHWDLLISNTWVNASDWVARQMGCWSLIGLGMTCEN